MARGRLPGRDATTPHATEPLVRREHRLPGGRKFAYHPFQREAVETLIWLYEVVGVRRFKAMAELCSLPANARLLRYDEFARYCVKMATGSGRPR